MPNDYFISVIYPDYEVATGSPGATRIGSGTADLGHTGLAYVNGSTGEIRYFDYGRYQGTDGIIVEPLISNGTGYTNINVQDVQSGNFNELGSLLSSTSGYTGAIQFNVFEVQEGSFETLNSTIDPALGVENSFYGDWTFFNTCHNFMQDMALIAGVDIDALDGFSATPSGSAASLFSNSGGTLYSPGLGISINFDANGQNSFLEAIESGQLTLSQSIELLGQWALSYDNLPSANLIVGGIATLALMGNSGDLAALESTLSALAEQHPEMLLNPEFLSRVAPAFLALGGREAWGSFLNEHLDGGCFAAGTMVDMWPLPDEVRLTPTEIPSELRFGINSWKKPIEQVAVGDLVVTFDKDSKLLPGRVTQKFVHQAKIVLDFYGTAVTPGHVYFRADSNATYKFETLIDILRSDGTIMDADGIEIRASTGFKLDDPRDQMVWAVAGQREANGDLKVMDRGQIRVGTRYITDDGKDICVDDMIKAAGATVADDGWVNDGVLEVPFLWPFGETLPKPEDYVLQRSGTTLEAIYKASEWEGQQPKMPAPMVRDGGPVRPHSIADRMLMRRNVFKSESDPGYAKATKPNLRG